MNIDKYVKPSTLEEAFQFLSLEPRGKLLAGGAWLKLADADLPLAIDLAHLGISGITETVDEVRIGAMTSIAALTEDPILSHLYEGILAQAAGRILGPAVRNIATIGGSVMGKFGFSDLITPLLVMDARLLFFQHPEMSISEFLEAKDIPRDILVKIVINKVAARGYFHKVARTRLDFATLNVAVASLASGYRIAVGSRPGGAMLCPKAAHHLAFRQNPPESVWEEAAELAAKECHCTTNQRASAEYREQLAKTYVGRGLKAVSLR